MKSYYPLIDFLRFIAAFWVMSFHYFLGLSGELSWYRYGNLGVPLFFIISGFVISLSISHNSIKKFAYGRWLRLFPLFWIACTVTYLFTLLVKNGAPVTFNEYLLSMTMLGEKLINVFGYTRIVDPVYWSLVIELVFYVAIGVFVYLFSWKRIRYFTYAWFLVSILSFILNINDTFIAKMLLVRHASYFLFGITLSLIIMSSYKNKISKIIDYISLVLFALYGIYISQFALPPYFIPHPLDTTNIMIIHLVFFIGMIIAVYYSNNISNRFILRILVAVGGITYPLYLLHQTIGVTLLKNLNVYAKVTTYGFGMMVAMILLAYAFYRLDKNLRAHLLKKYNPK